MADTISKNDLIETLASKVDLPRASAERVVNVLLEEVGQALHRGDKVNISGFGAFSVSSRAARQGRNPKTGETIEIPASRVAKFKPGKGLKDLLG